MPEPLTDRQRQVYEFIREEIIGDGVPPTLQEIGLALGIKSLRGVTDHLDALERKGWIERPKSKGMARCIRLIAEIEEEAVPAPLVVALPLYGSIAAGGPIEMADQIEDYYPVPQDFVREPEACFLLRIKGDSMIGDAICDGDLVIIQRQETARSGDIVAVRLEGDATLKHYVSIGGRVELHSSNPAYAPIPVDKRNSGIVGKLVGLIRRYR